MVAERFCPGIGRRKGNENFLNYISNETDNSTDTHLLPYFKPVCGVQNENGTCTREKVKIEYRETPTHRQRI